MGWGWEPTRQHRPPAALGTRCLSRPPRSSSPSSSSSRCISSPCHSPPPRTEAYSPLPPPLHSTWPQWLPPTSRPTSRPTHSEPQLVVGVAVAVGCLVHSLGLAPAIQLRTHLRANRRERHLHSRLLASLGMYRARRLTPSRQQLLAYSGTHQMLCLTLSKPPAYLGMHRLTLTMFLGTPKPERLRRQSLGTRRDTGKCLQWMRPPTRLHIGASRSCMPFLDPVPNDVIMNLHPDHIPYAFGLK